MKFILVFEQKSPVFVEFFIIVIKKSSNIEELLCGWRESNLHTLRYQILSLIYIAPKKQKLTQFQLVKFLSILFEVI